MSTIIVGEKIPLYTKLFDQWPDAIIRAEVKNETGDPLATVYLYHLSDGLYFSYELFTPNVKYILVTYHVENSEEYADSAEMFYVEQAQGETVKFITGAVFKVVENQEFKRGVITHETKTIK